MAFKLADLTLEFSSPQANAVKEQMDDLKSGIKAVAGIAQMGLGFGSATLGGWITAGLSGTVQGQQLLLSTQQLAHEITAVFLPVIEKVTGFINDVTDWFRDLTGEQQESLASWTLWGAGALAMTSTIGRVIAVGALLVKAVQSLTKRFDALTEEHRNPDKWLQKKLEQVRKGYHDALGEVRGEDAYRRSAYYEVAKARGWIDPMTGNWRETSKAATAQKPGAGHRGVGMDGGGFESMTQTYKRIQAAVDRTAPYRSYEEQTADNWKAIAKSYEDRTAILARIDGKLRPVPPSERVSPQAAPTKLAYYKGGTPEPAHQGAFSAVGKLDDFISTLGGLGEDARGAPQGTALGRFLARL